MGPVLPSHYLHWIQAGDWHETMVLSPVSEKKVFVLPLIKIVKLLYCWAIWISHKFILELSYPYLIILQLIGIISAETNARGLWTITTVGCYTTSPSMSISIKYCSREAREAHFRPDKSCHILYFLFDLKISESRRVCSRALRPSGVDFLRVGDWDDRLCTAHSVIVGSFNFNSMIQRPLPFNPDDSVTSQLPGILSRPSGIIVRRRRATCASGAIRCRYPPPNCRFAV